MAKVQNAFTKYEVAALAETPEVWLSLGPDIRNVTPNTPDTTNEDSFYDGDGTLQTDVTGTTEEYTFEGDRNEGNPTQEFIIALQRERKIGTDRTVMFRITDPDGTKHTGPATVSNITYRGGLAHEVPPFSCTIRFNGKPTVEEVAG